MSVLGFQGLPFEAALFVARGECRQPGVSGIRANRKGKRFVTVIGSTCTSDLSSGREKIGCAVLPDESRFLAALRNDKDLWNEA
jgi:hypothetical protein